MKRDQPVLSKTALAVLLIAALLVCGTGAAAAVFLYNWLQPRSSPPPLTTAETPLSDRGLLITAVLPAGAAAEAGLRRGDILLQADDTTLTVPEDLQRVVRTHEAGDEIELLVLRGEKTTVFPVTLAPALPRLGLEVLAAAPAAAPPEIGRVLADSPAAGAGLAAGDVITAVDGRPVTEGDALINLMQTKQPGDTLALTVSRAGEIILLSVTLTTHPDASIARGYLGIELAP